MRLKLFATMIALVVLGVMLAGTGVAMAHDKDSRLLRLVGTEIQSELVDVGAPGPSLGDQFVFSQRLFRFGEEVGMSGAVCTIVQAAPPYDVLTFHCVGTFSLRRGQITVQGLIEVQGEDDPGPFILAITGGTGAYRSVGGQAVIRDVSDTRTIFKLFLDFPKKKKR